MNRIVTMGSTIGINTPAKAIGYHVEMIRYFKKEGLIFSSKKATNGYGIYFDIQLKALYLIHNVNIWIFLKLKFASWVN